MSAVAEAVRTSSVVVVKPNEAIFIAREDLVQLYDYVLSVQKPASQLSNEAWQQQNGALELIKWLLALPGADSSAKYALVEPHNEEVAEKVLTLLFTRSDNLKKKFAMAASNSVTAALNEKVSKLEADIKALRVEKSDTDKLMKEKQREIDGLEAAVQEYAGARTQRGAKKP